MDKLKQYLQEHRHEMDVETPPADLLQQIQADVMTHAAKALLIKYIVAISVMAVISAAWLMIRTPDPTPPPVIPPKEVIQKDTLPISKDTVRKLQKIPPAQPVIRKQKRNTDTINYPAKIYKKKIPDTVHPKTQPRIKKKALLPVI